MYKKINVKNVYYFVSKKKVLNKYFFDINFPK